MTKTVELTLTPEEAFNEAGFAELLQTKLSLSSEEYIHPVRRSIDARGKKVVVRLLVEVLPKDQKPPLVERRYEDVSRSASVIIVGAGPAGLFAALRLIELGIKPVIIERGKDVQARRRDLASINKDHLVNPESNYCFGEGGAGTYSDGKLYTRSKKRGDVNRILEILVAHGAKEDIRYDAHPHIGTNKLPRVVAQLRERILAAGGEIHFNTRMTDVTVSQNELKGIVTTSGEVKGEAVILAAGHSARDVYRLLADRKIVIECKPFALGVRVEHPQQLIDQIQYHCTDRGVYLPASSYSLVHQAHVEGRQHGVFSFCMCPGGFIVPSATSPGEIVVNGMSPSRRDSRFANSGIVMTVDEKDFEKYSGHGPLAGVMFQANLERKAFEIGGGRGQSAPAQRLVDFVEGKISSQLPDTSYQPGLTSVDLATVLPSFLVKGLREGFRDFGKKMKGYLTNEAQVVGVESRTSSPVRIPRHKETLEHISMKRLFPCGEGAGYAGGIVSAAIDGERCAEAVATLYVNKNRHE